MRWPALLVVLFVLVSGRSVQAEDDAPPDLAMRADDVLRGDDDLYKGLREALLQRTPAEIVAVLDAVRREAGLAVAHVGGMQTGLEVAPDPDGPARAEAAVLERALAEALPWFVRVEAHIVALEEERAVVVLTGGRAVGDGSLCVIDDAMARKLLRSSGVGEVSRSTALVPLDLLDGQTGTTGLAARTRYLMDYEFEIPDTGPHAILGRISEGVEVSVTVRRAGDGARLSATVDACSASLRRPVALYRTEPTPGAPTRSIHLPELGMQRLRGLVDMGVGEWLAGRVSRGGPFSEPDQLLLLRATRLPSPREYEPAPGAGLAPDGAGAACGG